jgi:hypothetical protein
VLVFTKTYIEVRTIVNGSLLQTITPRVPIETIRFLNSHPGIYYCTRYIHQTHWFLLFDQTVSGEWKERILYRFIVCVCILSYSYLLNDDYDSIYEFDRTPEDKEKNKPAYSHIHQLRLILGVIHSQNKKLSQFKFMHRHIYLILILSYHIFHIYNRIHNNTLISCSLFWSKILLLFVVHHQYRQTELQSDEQ